MDNLTTLKKNRNNHEQIQGQMAVANCTHSSFFVYTFNGYHLEKIFFDEIYQSSILKNLTWFWHNQLAPYLLYNKDDKKISVKKKKIVI